MSKTFDLNDLKFGKIEKMPISITLQEFEPLVPNFLEIVFDDVI